MVRAAGGAQSLDTYPLTRIQEREQQARRQESSAARSVERADAEQARLHEWEERLQLAERRVELTSDELGQREETLRELDRALTSRESECNSRERKMDQDKTHTATQLRQLEVGCSGLESERSQAVSAQEQQQREALQVERKESDRRAEVCWRRWCC